MPRLLVAQRNDRVLQSSAEPLPRGSDPIELPNLTIPYPNCALQAHLRMLYPKKRQGPRQLAALLLVSGGLLNSGLL